MSDDFEELEHIPWAALAAGTPSPRNRYLGIAAAATVLLVFAAWMLTKDSNPSAIALASPVASIPTPTGDAPPSTGSAPTTTAVYSEADLMLIDTADEERLAIAQAEWLVRDFLTVDDDARIVERIDHLLPKLARPETPTYVEWVKAFAVEKVEPGRYRVEVLYRTLSGTEDGYVRQPAAALAVQLSIDVGGSARLVAGPEPAPVPVLLGSSD